MSWFSKLEKQWESAGLCQAVIKNPSTQKNAGSFDLFGAGKNKSQILNFFYLVLKRKHIESFYIILQYTLNFSSARANIEKKMEATLLSFRTISEEGFS